MSVCVPVSNGKGADAAVAEADVDRERVARESAALDVGIVPSL